MGRVHAVCPVAPTRDLEGSEQPGLGVAYSSLDPFVRKWRRGPLLCPPSMQTRGGMRFQFAHSPRSHAPFACKQRQGAKGFIHSRPLPPAPHLHVTPARKLRVEALLPSVCAAHCSCVAFVCDDTLNLP